MGVKGVWMDDLSVASRLQRMFNELVPVASPTPLTTSRSPHPGLPPAAFFLEGEEKT